MIAPLDNGVNDKSFWGEHNISLHTITRIILLKVTYNIGSVFNFHNKKGEGRDPQAAALDCQKVLLLEECFQFFDLNLLCFNSLNEDRSKS